MQKLKFRLISKVFIPENIVGRSCSLFKSMCAWTREQLLEAVPEARTLPQIFLDDKLIGGFTELRKHFQG